MQVVVSLSLDNKHDDAISFYRGLLDCWIAITRQNDYDSRTGTVVSHFIVFADHVFLRSIGTDKPIQVTIDNRSRCRFHDIISNTGNIIVLFSAKNLAKPFSRLANIVWLYNRQYRFQVQYFSTCCISYEAPRIASSHTNCRLWSIQPLTDVQWRRLKM